MKPKNDPAGKILRYAGGLLVLGAFCLTLCNLWDENRAARSAEESLQQIIDQMPQSRTQSQLPNSAESEPQTQSRSVPEDSHLSGTGLEMPAVEVDGELYIGVISLPKLEIVLPVMKDWSNAALRVSPCRYQGSPYEGNMIIIAHNYRRHFGRLWAMEAGDSIAFTDTDGKEFCYEVLEVQRLSDPTMEEIEKGEWDLILFTCTTEGSGRIVVRCRSAEDK